MRKMVQYLSNIPQEQSAIPVFWESVAPPTNAVTMDISSNFINGEERVDCNYAPYFPVAETCDWSLGQDCSTTSPLYALFWYPTLSLTPLQMSILTPGPPSANYVTNLSTHFNNPAAASYSTAYPTQRRWFDGVHHRNRRRPVIRRTVLSTTAAAFDSVGCETIQHPVVERRSEISSIAEKCSIVENLEALQETKERKGYLYSRTDSKTFSPSSSLNSDTMTKRRGAEPAEATVVPSSEMNGAQTNDDISTTSSFHSLSKKSTLGFCASNPLHGCKASHQNEFYPQDGAKTKVETRDVEGTLQSDQKNLYCARLLQQFSNTKMCVYEMKGICSRGSACKFAHSFAEMREPPDLYKTKICEHARKGGCFMGSQCKFAHSDKELRHTPKFYKSSLCVLYQSGMCRRGRKCRYAHGSGELNVSNETVESSVKSANCIID